LTPQHGDAGRLLLSLFLLTHGYVQRVPMTRLLDYEAGLHRLLCVLPPPEALPAAAGAGRQQLLTEASPFAAMVAGTQRSAEQTGFYRVPAGVSGGPGDGAGATTRGGADAGAVSPPPGQPWLSLLDAALAAPVPPDMANGIRIDLATSFRENTRRLAGRLRPAGHDADSFGAAAAAAGGATEAFPSRPPGPPPKFSFWKALTGQGNKPKAAPRAAAGGGGGVVAAAAAAAAGASGSPAPAAAAAARSVVAGEMSGVGGHLRLDAGTDLSDLPPVWAAMHAVVSEYTRAFCGEPPM
jgi:hypothetical protein